MLIPFFRHSFPNYRTVLESLGMPSENIDSAMNWAFGHGYGSMLIVDSIDKFNQLHPGLYSGNNYIELLKTIYLNFK